MEENPRIIPQMSYRPHTRRRFLAFTATATAVIASFFAGQFFEHFKNGRWYKVHDQQEVTGNVGTVRLNHVTDTEGWPFLDPSDSVIFLQTESGLQVKLYQSKRGFQEQWPWVDDVQIEDDRVKWSDGVSRYTLQIEPIAPTTQP